MKKAVRYIIILIFLLSLILPCYANSSVHKNQWVWLNNSESVGMFYDKSRIFVKSERGHQKVNLWTLNYYDINTPKEILREILWTIDITDKKIYLIEGNTYNMRGELLDSWKADDTTGKPISPNSLAEAMYNVARKYIIDKTKKVK